MIGNCRMGRGSPIVNCRGCQRVKGEEGGGGGLVCVRLYLVEVCAWSHVRGMGFIPTLIISQVKHSKLQSDFVFRVLNSPFKCLL